MDNQEKIIKIFCNGCFTICEECFHYQKSVKFPVEQMKIKRDQIKLSNS